VYTVKELADLAGVSVRTLHYYDEIDLLKPSVVGENSYRYYDEAALLRLQQILFYREMDLGLLQIREILNDPSFDLVTALRTHRQTLQDKIARLQNLMNTVDATIMHLVGEMDMGKKRLFEGFSEEKQKQYEKEIRDDKRYDQKLVDQSIKLWNSYTDEDKARIQEEGGQVYLDLVALIEKGHKPDSPEVQAILPRWHQHLRYFYEPNTDVLRGLGDHYNGHPDFIAFFQKIHPNLPEFLQQAINVYVDELETRILIEMDMSVGTDY
jgi:MerR family transcriptional regulator, thiopeptide resistance regulator